MVLPSDSTATVLYSKMIKKEWYHIYIPLYLHVKKCPNYEIMSQKKKKKNTGELFCKFYNQLKSRIHLLR